MGHTYLVESILIASKNKSGVVDMENEIYPELMNKYRVTKWSIERIMRDRIEKTWKKTAVEILEQEYTQQVDPEREAGAEGVHLLLCLTVSLMPTWERGPGPQGPGPFATQSIVCIFFNYQTVIFF